MQQTIPANVGYRGFPKTVCTSVNHVVCHGIPNDRKLKAGDIVNIDVAVIKDGYHGDTSRMYFVGKPPVLAQRLTEVCKRGDVARHRAGAPGAHLGDIGHAIQSLAEAEGFSVVREYCGHGIGRVYHEDPQVLHYGEPGTGLELRAGMVFTIEPMINAGKRHVRVLPDGWTVVTKDHSLSAQWEHMVLVTPERARSADPEPRASGALSGPSSRMAVSDATVLDDACAAAPARRSTGRCCNRLPALLAESNGDAESCRSAAAAGARGAQERASSRRSRSRRWCARARASSTCCCARCGSSDSSPLWPSALALVAVGGYGRGELHPVLRHRLAGAGAGTAATSRSAPASSSWCPSCGTSASRSATACAPSPNAPRRAPPTSG